MFRILNRLEDPKRPLLGPNVKALKFWGLLLPKNMMLKYFSLLIHALVIAFLATEYVDIWFLKNDLNLLLNNLKITMLATVGVIKVFTFLIWQERWRSIIDYVTRADIAQRATDDVKKNELIVKTTNYCRRITYFYWSLMYTTVIIVIFTPLLKYSLSSSYRYNVKNGTEKYMEVISSWVPLDKSTIPGYLAASLYQCFAAIFGGGFITSFDTNAVVIMAFFKAELELLKIDSVNIFGTTDASHSDKMALKNMKKCIRRHVELMKFSELFDSCLSPIMLLYVLVCSVMLCVTTFQITSETSLMQRFLTTEYLVFGIAQLFIYCWHSNEVLFASLELSQGPYESTWWCRHVSHRKNLIIMTSQFSRTTVFTAGPFTLLTVATFINILKGAYSYYTLLSKSQIKT